MRNIDQALILNLARIIWGNSTGKIGGAVALAGVSALPNIVSAIATAVAARFGFEVTIPEAPIWFNVMLVVLGLVVVVCGAYFQRSNGQKLPQISAHDIELFARYQTLISEADLDFLRTQDFGAPFAFGSVNGFCEIGGQWEGPRYEFSGPELEVAFGAVKKDAKSFTSAILTHVHPVRSNTNMATTKPDDPRAHYGEKHRATNRKLNEIATKLTESLEAFERLAYVQLR